ncbi:MAG: hypothetical protein AAGF99_17310, partial [Bacteroidota bacterium]
MSTFHVARPYSPRQLRARAERRLRWLRRSATAGTLTLAMLHGAPDAAAQIASDPAGGEFQVNTFTANQQTNASVAMDADGDFVVAWQSSAGQDGSSFGVYAQRYAADGTPQGGEFLVNTRTTFDQDDPFVAMDADGDFVIVWTSSGQDAPTGGGIFAQRYDAAGVAQGSEFQVNTYTTSTQNKPSVAMDADGDFVIAWQSAGQDDPSAGFTPGIYAQRYDAAGVAQGSEFRVNTFTTGSQSDPSVAMDADGDFTVAWSGYGQDDPSAAFVSGVFAQRYAADGTTQGGEFQVNTFTTNSQVRPSVAMDADGDFVVAWTSGGQDDPLYSGIFAQRYNAAGVAQGSEFQVNTFVTGNQSGPSVGMDADGDFVVAWTSGSYFGAAQDGSYYGIYAQRYDAAGVAQGSEFLVNTVTTGGQFGPSVATDDSGDFVVAWQSGGNQDGNSEGIFAQRYADPTVFDYDAQTYVDNGALDFDRLATWPDAGPLGLDAPVRGSDAR